MTATLRMAGPAHRTPRSVRFRATCTRATPAALALAAADAASALPGLGLTGHLITLVGLLVVPGACLVVCSGIDLEDRAVRVVAAIAASVLLLLLYGLAASAIDSSGSPLSWAPLIVGFTAVSIVVLGLAARRAEPLGWLTGNCPLSLPRFLGGLLCAIPPVAAAAGAGLLDNGGNGLLAQLTFIGGGLLLLGLLVAGERIPSWLSSGVIFGVSVAFLWAFSVRGSYLFGTDIQQEHLAAMETLTRGRFSPPANGDAYRSMLSITVLPAELARLTHLSVVTLDKFVYPAFMALFPVLVFKTMAAWFPRRAALLPAVYLCLLPQFAAQMPALTRQEVALVFFGLLVYLLIAVRPSGLARHLCILGTIAGLVLSHYTSSYLADVILIITWLVYGLMRIVGRIGRHRLPPGRVVLAHVAAAAGLTALWDGAITHSTGNVSQVLGILRASGAEILPNNGGQSPISRYLNGNVVSQITPQSYYRHAAAYAKLNEPWLRALPASVTHRYPAQVATVPTVRPDHPSLFNPLLQLQTATTEIMLLAIVVGVVVLVLSARARRRSVSAETVVQLLVFLAFLTAIRLSGTLAQAYNQERAQVQSIVLVGIGLALVGTWVFRRRVVGTLVVVALLAVSWLQTSGVLAGVTGGGGAPAFANAGRAYYEFRITNQDVAAASWLGAAARRDALVYVDAYGIYRLRAGTDAPLSVQQLLTPATINAGSWVYAGSSNVGRGLAFGSSEGATVYAYPFGFLDDKFSLVYASPLARVYK